jgi:nitrite reductase/ring-hydroxylating ferredoxin subunit
MIRYVVAPVTEVPPGSRRQVRVGGRQIVVFNVDGRFFALRDICPHRGALLSDGKVLGSLTSTGAGDYCYDDRRSFIKCPWHGWEFDLATGQSWCAPDTERVRSYPVSVHAGAEVAASPLADSAISPVAGERTPGPYTAETVGISVEDDYVVVEI